MKSKRLVSRLVLLTLFILTSGRAQTLSPSASAFLNGKWFDRSGFGAATFYAVSGKLTEKKPFGSIDTVDLHGGFVVPPLGDAHNHFLESEGTLALASTAFLRAGVFYVLNANDIAELSNPLRGRLGESSTVDVVFAHGGFTKTGGHPTALYQGLVDRKILSFSKSELEGRGFYSVDSLADIEENWPQYLTTKPDFVKPYLLHSELCVTPKPNRASDGLLPTLVPELTRRARAAGLRSGA